MKIKTSLLGVVTGGCIAVAAILGIYTATYLTPSFEKAEFKEQKLVLSNLDNYINEKLDLAIKNSKDLVLEPFYDLRDRAFKLTEDNKNLASISLPNIAIRSFSKNDLLDKQLFDSKRGFPQGRDCFKVLKTPENLQSYVKEKINKVSHDFNRFVCYGDKYHKFFGYLIPVKNDVTNYLYLEKYDNPKEFIFPEAKELLKDLNFDLAKVVEDKKVVILNQNKEILKSTLDGFMPGNLNDSLIKEAKSDGLRQDVINLNNKDFLVSVSYNKQGQCYLVNFTPRGEVIGPVITSFVVLIVVLLIVAAISLYLVIKNAKKFEDSLEVSEKKLDEILNSKLENISENQFKFDDEKEPKLIELKNINEKISLLGANLQKDLPQIIKKHDEDSFKKGCIESLINIQSYFQPQAMPSSRYVDIAAFLIPAKDHITDFYDLFRVDKENVCVVIGSCSKPGLIALEAMAYIKALIRTSLHIEHKHPSEALTLANKYLEEYSKEKDFTIQTFVIILSEFTGNYIYANAGFASPFLVHLHKATKLDKEDANPVLGLTPSYSYKDCKGKINYGDVLYFGGRGFTSIKNKDGEVFGLDRTKEACEELFDKNAADLLISLYKKIKTFGKDGDSNLDMTAVCIKKSGADSEF